MKTVEVISFSQSYYSRTLENMLKEVEKLLKENRGKTFLLTIEEVEEFGS
jgi:hypothetical protein